MRSPARSSAPRADANAPKLAPRRRQSTWIQPVLLFAALVLLVNSVVGEQGLADSVRARRRIQAALVNLAVLRAENARLREQSRRLQHDPRAIEDVARRDLGLLRRDEILVVLKDKTP